jgi:NAD(P) transhydrogenase subunit beta
MAMQEMLIWLAKASYFLAAVLFILGIKRMASPVTARKGIVQAGIGMVIATLATFAITGGNNLLLILAGIAIGVIPTWLWGKKVAMTDMPQMVALFNGMGGGSAAAIGAGELLKMSDPAHGDHALVTVGLAVLGALIGSVSMTGSIIAWAKLDGRMDKRFNFPGQQVFNFLVLGAALIAGIALIAWHVDPMLIVAFFVLALLFGVLMTLPIGGADMPVVISLFNALTGLAVAFEGYVMHIEALIIAGTVVGAAGTFLTQLMAKAMNRPISGVLFSNFGGGGSGEAIAGAQKPIEASDAASLLYMAEKVIIVPGYGMAVAQAQHKIWELTQALIKAGKEVKFAIHPVAGRMPGHMNVLLAEANVPYDALAEMDDINGDLPQVDVAIVVGANDVVNPAARHDKSSPIYGMPIIDVDKCKTVLAIKRTMNPGFAGIDNELYTADNTLMLFGDAKAVLSEVVKALSGESGMGH